ncbi:MAG TPA: disulfide bond formation protein DsbA [Gammaproteobacteria bacterium]|nr:disulfide bond formation protein DsbA [Gammaproteobacteria bacterium]|tara:strand:+ start:2618 stop:3229 length:612 start_codon:yes stop_codon:yes gene_type:complete
MSLNIEFHYDFGSPNTYFCHRLIPGIEERTGAQINYCPVLLGGIFKATNNRSPMEQFAEVKNKNEYQALEMKRFIARHHFSDYRSNPHFPINTINLMRGAVYASHQDYYKRYIEAMYRCMWEQGKNMADPEVIAESLSEHGLPADEIVAAMQNPAIKQELISNTSRSVERGAFGSPTFFVGDEMLFGKDRLLELEEEIVSQMR